jgi:NAD-dependent DNA ligase
MKLPHPYQQLEDTIMGHRFLYYIECNPIIEDCEYDALERNSRSLLKDKIDSPVHSSGSELSSDYSDKIKQLALHWIEL